MMDRVWNLRSHIILFVTTSSLSARMWVEDTFTQPSDVTLLIITMRNHLKAENAHQN